MADTKDSAANNALASVTIDDFREFLEDKIKVHLCPFCQTAAWAMFNTKEYNFGIIAFQKNGGFAIPPPNIPALGMACKTCGYIRLHAIDAIARWKVAKAAEK